MNRFFGFLVFLVKMVVALFFVGLLLAFRSQDSVAQVFGLFFLGFLTVATIFLLFFGKSFLERYPRLKIWHRILLAVYVLCLVFLLVTTILGFYRINDREKTQKAVDFINSKRITLFDVYGNNLPPKPDQTLNDSTIAGIDANQNFIRDDVELAIFNKYPNSAKIRAAELQYAQALQLELTQVFDSGTLEEVFRKRSHGQSCIAIGFISSVADNRINEVENLVLNINPRKSKQLDGLKYMTTSSVPATREECDISPLLFSN